MGNNLKKEYILVLPSWYPSKLDEFNGDFNERLVNAVSNYRTQVVIYVSTKRNSMLSETEVFQRGNITTYKIYFKNSKYEIINFMRMVKSYLSIFKQTFDKHGLPALVHNYVFFPAGIISVYLKHRYKLKVILTEHWTIFDTNRSNAIINHSLHKKLIYKVILNSFDQTISVSEKLNIFISEWATRAENHVLPNVVNVEYFNLEQLQRSNQPFTFVHVSNMAAHNGFHKNVAGILNVFNKIIKDGFQVNLILVGKKNKEISDYIERNILLNEKVKVLNEIPYQSVSQTMKSAHAFVLFSRYENMPCVILEALCCGLPVVSSNVGGITTVIDETNGILVESENENQLEEAMLSMMKNYHKYDTHLISENAIKAFNYDIIGKKVNDIYTEILK